MNKHNFIVMTATMLACLLLMAPLLEATTLPAIVSPDTIVLKDADGNVILSGNFTGNFTGNPGVIELATFIISKNDSLYMMWNGGNGTLAYSNSNLTKVEQFAVGNCTAGGLVALKEVQWNISLSLGSNNVLVIEEYLGSYRCYSNQGKGFLLAKLASDPSTAGWGDAEAPYWWYNTAEDTIKYWNGSAIVVVPGIGGGAPPGGTYTMPYTYTIFNSGGTTYAETATGTIAYSDTNASYVFNQVSAAASTVKGSIFVKSGEYNLTHSVKMKNNTVWDGEGYGAHIFMAPNRPHASNDQWEDYWCVFVGRGTSFYSNITIRNLNLDGNYANNNNDTNISHGHGIILFEGGAYISVENCWIHDHITWGVTYYALGFAHYCCSVIHCKVYNTQWNGISFYAYGSQPIITDCLAEGNLLWGEIGDIALQCGGINTSICHCVFTNNIVANMTGTHGGTSHDGGANSGRICVRIEEGHDCIISNNVLAGRNGIMDNDASLGNHTIIGNEILIMYQSGQSDGYGMWLYSHHNLIMGNTIKPYSGDWTVIQGLRLEGQYNRVIGNSIISSDTSIYDYNAPNYYFMNDLTWASHDFWNSTAYAPRTGSVAEHNIGYP